ncbi:MAG: hypothetical protein WD598_16370 [Acidimicrobiia bacterium]
MNARGTAGTDGHLPEVDAITRAELPSDRPVPRDPSHPTRDPHPHARPTPSSTAKPTAPIERCVECKKTLEPPLAWFCNSKCIDAYARTWNPGAEQAVDQLLEANGGQYPPKSATPASRASTRQPTQEEKP